MAASTPDFKARKRKDGASDMTGIRGGLVAAAFNHSCLLNIVRLLQKAELEMAINSTFFLSLNLRLSQQEEQKKKLKSRTQTN